MSNAFVNSFYKVFSVDQLYMFEDLFNELEPKLKAINMSPNDYITHLRDSYKRYQEYKGLDPFYPMDKKGFKYVEQYLRKAVESTYREIISSKIDSSK